MIFSLVSGSSGNSTLIVQDNTVILLDCGASGKKLSLAIESLGIACSSINAILLTHEHSDHVMGAGVMSRRFDIPIYATAETFGAMKTGPIKDENINIISPGEGICIGDVEAVPFAVSHDAANPVGFFFDLKEGKFSVLTDTGVITNDIYNHVKDSKFMILESNHDVEMLQFGGYPFPLKKRILGRTGHLSNNTAAAMSAKMLENGVERIMLGHLSTENNTPEIAYKTTENALSQKGGIVGRDIALSVAKRYEITRFV